MNEQLTKWVVYVQRNPLVVVDTEDQAHHWIAEWKRTHHEPVEMWAEEMDYVPDTGGNRSHEHESEDE